MSERAGGECDAAEASRSEVTGADTSSGAAPGRRSSLERRYTGTAPAGNAGAAHTTDPVRPSPMPIVDPFAGMLDQPCAIQTKLDVGQPGDQFEQEADRVADAVVAGGAAPRELARTVSAVAQCKDDPDGPDDPAGDDDGDIIAVGGPGEVAAPADDPSSATEDNLAPGQPAAGLMISAKPASTAGLDTTADLDGQIAASAGGGTSMPSGARGFMESRFGADFGDVRMHTGSRSAQMNQQLGSQAFTHGKDIYFDEGRYQPDSHQGRHLIAHELTHVLQQTGGKRVQRQGGHKKKKPKRAYQYLFRVSATQVGKPREFLVHTFRTVFGMREGAARALIKNEDWHWKTPKNYPGPSARDVKRGYVNVRFDVAAYNHLKGLAEGPDAEQRGADGKRTGAAERNEAFKKLPKKTQGEINKETNRVFWQRTHYKVGKRLGNSAQDKKMAKLWLDIRDEIMAERKRKADKATEGLYSTYLIQETAPASYKGHQLRVYLLMVLGKRTWEAAEAASKNLAWFESRKIRRSGDTVSFSVNGNEYAQLTGTSAHGAGKTHAGAGTQVGSGDKDKGTGDNDKGTGDKDKGTTDRDKGTADKPVVIPPHLLQLFGSNDPKKYDQKKLRRVVNKLEKLTLPEVQLFKSLATHLAKNLDLFEKSLDAFFKFRDEYKAAIDKATASKKKEPTLRQKLDDTYTGFNYAKWKKLSHGDRLARARELAAEQRNKQLKHMATHPGETLKGMARGLNPVDVGKGVWKDVQDAANGKKGGFARWAAGVGAVGKISGWLAGVAGVLFIATMLIPGVNIAALATTALVAGATAVALSAVESELHIRAAADAKSEGDVKSEINKAGTSEANFVVGGVMMTAGLAFRMIAKIRLPGRLKNVGNAFKMASKALGEKTGLSKVKATLLATLKRERGGLPEALAKEMAAHKKAAAVLEKVSADEFINRLAKGDKALQELTGITPEQARTLQQLGKTPGAEHVAQKLLDQYKRAVREAPGSAWAKVNRIVDKLDNAIKRVESATSPDELRTAINDVAKQLDQHGLLESELAARSAELKERWKEGLVKEPEQPKPNASATPPAGMSSKLVELRKTLKDPKAIERFDMKFDRLGKDSARMEKVIENMTKKGPPLEEKLVNEWAKANPALKKPYGSDLAQVPELVVEAEALLDDITPFVDKKVAGAAELRKRVDAQLEHLEKIRAGHIGASAETVTNIRNALAGVKGELRSALTNKGVTRFSYKPKAGGEKADVDVVADNGKTWIDAKETNPFTTKSSDWNGSEGLEKQAERLVRVAKQSPIDGKPPTVVYEFHKGVTASVARALKKIGKEAGVRVEVRGRILNDTSAVVPPGRVDYMDKDE